MNSGLTNNNRYVKILKDGIHEGITYKKGEILLAIRTIHKQDSIVTLVNGAVVTLIDSYNYGTKEAEIYNFKVKKFELWAY